MLLSHPNAAIVMGASAAGLIGSTHYTMAVIMATIFGMSKEADLVCLLETVFCYLCCGLDALLFASLPF